MHGDVEAPVCGTAEVLRKPQPALIAAFEQSGLALSSNQLSDQLLVILAPRAGAKFGWKKEINVSIKLVTSFVETMCAKTLLVDGCVMTWHHKSTVIVETSLRFLCGSSLSPISGTVISKWNAKVPLKRECWTTEQRFSSFSSLVQGPL